MRRLALILALALSGLARAEGEPTISLRTLDPGVARKQALWPGILLHGAGHRYAQDNDTFYSLVGGELFSLLVGGFGAHELFGPEKKGEHKSMATTLAVTGAVLFVGTWAWDIAFAPGKARAFNQERGLSLAPRLDGTALSWRF